jgi:hypothetical protein
MGLSDVMHCARLRFTVEALASPLVLDSARHCLRAVADCLDAPVRHLAGDIVDASVILQVWPASLNNCHFCPRIFFISRWTCCVEAFFWVRQCEQWTTLTLCHC